MDIIGATAAYERWVGEQVTAQKRDLALKHKKMAEGPFSFLRAAFYRWVTVWRTACADLAKAPAVLAVGDLHVENFGTWRDAEGRLVWGLNDADEAGLMPFTMDLVRLTTSALLALEEGRLNVRPKDASNAILEGYMTSLSGRVKPFVLEERHRKLRAMALSADRAPKEFWRKLCGFPRAEPPAAVRALLEAHLPGKGSGVAFIRRISGYGSLGRPRYVAITEVAGGYIAREAKALTPSAYAWAMGKPQAPIFSDQLLRHAVRCPDPFHSFKGHWQIRRLAPHCSRIELADLPTKRDELHLLRAMGQETGNIHSGSSSKLPAVRRYINKANPNWLFLAAKGMAKATHADWRAWKEGQ